jgi:succinate dehydrogenase / fumarate reductase cytochrome b subunit
LVNASLLNSAATFQSNVYRIHRLGGLLWVMEWVFIFLPFLFHAVLGLIIIRGGSPNVGNYPYGANVRYTIQRVTAIIALFFISWHVFHMHGWFHFEGWVEKVADPLFGSQFRPFNAASSVALGMRPIVVPVLYAIGILACVFHLANGIWTMGITWGIWTSPGAQRRANWVCLAAGVVVVVLGAAALLGTQILAHDHERLREALDAEEQMMQAMLEHEEITEITLEQSEHKSWTKEELEAIRSEIGEE